MKALPELYFKILFYYALLIGLMALLFGVAHNYFVLDQGKPYSKELAYLITTGNIMIFSGLMTVILSKYLKQKIILAYIVALINTIFLLSFCLSLIPFFKNGLNNLLILLYLIFLLLIGYTLFKNSKKRS